MSRPLTAFAVIIAAQFIAAPAKAARTITIDPTCMASGTCTSPCTSFLDATVDSFDKVIRPPGSSVAPACAPQSGDTILYRCLSGNCVINGPVELPGYFDRQKVTLQAYPSKSVTIRWPAPTSATDKPLLKFAHGTSGNAQEWVLDGFVVDGANGIATNPQTGRDSGPAHVVQVAADGVRIVNSIIKRGRFDACLRVDRDVLDPEGTLPSNLRQTVQNFSLENSEVAECTNPSREADAHCILSNEGQHLTFTGNKIHHCFGDGIQIQGINNGPTGAWRDVIIEGNTFWTDGSMNLKDKNGEAFRPGENAVDVKTGLGGLSIRNNIMHGYRGWEPWVRGNGSGAGGSGGDAIVIHASMPECRSFSSSYADANCVVERNDIFDSNNGIGFGFNSAHMTSPVTNLLIRRNFIHDMTADGARKTDARRQGTAFTTGRGVTVHLVHNTIANTPGLALFRSTDPGDADCSGCLYAYNIESRCGAPDENTQTPVLCDVTFGATGMVFRENRCFRSGNPNKVPPECSGTGGTIISGGFAFTDDLDYGKRCGSDGSPTASRSKESYRLTQSSPPAPGVLDSAVGSDDTFAACGSAQVLDIGADEYCASPPPPPATQLFSMTHDPTKGIVSVESREDIRMVTQFVSGVGAFENEMKYLSPLLPNSLCAQWSAPDDESCLLSTRSCNCSPQFTENGEINCSCIEPQVKSFAPPPQNRLQAARYDVETALKVWGTVAETRNAADFMQATKVSNNEYLLGWEDLDRNPLEGDRDDYIASLRAYRCSQDGLNELEGGLKYESRRCSSNTSTLCTDCDNTPPENLRYSYQLTADPKDQSVTPREGRQLHISVTLYNYEKSEVRLAVCPILSFISPPVPLTVYDYPAPGAPWPGCNDATVVAPGRPACTEKAMEGSPTVAFAQYQRFSGADICAADQPSDDAFTLPPNDICGPLDMPGSVTRNFEIPLWALDDKPGETGVLSGIKDLDNADIAAALETLSLYFVRLPKGERFSCPSALNVQLRHVHAGVGAISVDRFGQLTLAARGK